MKATLQQMSIVHIITKIFGRMNILSCNQLNVRGMIHFKQIK